MNKFEKGSGPSSEQEKNKKEEEHEGEKKEKESVESEEGKEKEQKEQKEKQEKSGGFFSKAKMIGKTAYSVISSIGGVKFISDIGLAFAKKGDLYNHFKQKGKVKEEKLEIARTLDEVAEAWRNRRERRQGGWEERKEGELTKENKELKDTISKFKKQLAGAESLPESEKQEFKKLLASILEKRSKSHKTAEEGLKARTEKVLGTYLQTKVKGTRIARDALNTAFTASGLLALRGAVYGGVALVERAKKANLEFSKEELRKSLKSKELMYLDKKISKLEREIEDGVSNKKEKELREKIDELFSERKELIQKHFGESQNSRLTHIIKDTTVNATVETVRGLAFKGREKESKHKGMDFVKSLGTVLRGFGIGSAAVNEIVNQGVSGAFEEANDSFLDAFEENGAMGVLGEMKDNFAERISSMFKIFGGKEVEDEVKGTEKEVGYKTKTLKSQFDKQSDDNLVTLLDKDFGQRDQSPGVAVSDSTEEVDFAGRPLVDEPDLDSEDIFPSIEAEPSAHMEEAAGSFEVGHADYQGSSSIWKEIENQIDSRPAILKSLQSLEDKSEASETHLIDYLKDQVVENPEEFGLPEDIDPDEVTAEQLKNTDWDKLFVTIKSKEGFSKAFSNLSESAKQNIIENNKILREVSQKTGEPISSEHVDQTLADVKESGGVDEYFKTNNQDLPIKETLTPSGGEEVEDVINLEDKDLGYMDDEERSLLQYIKQYRGENELPANVADDAQKEAAEMIIANATQEQINQYPDVQDAFKEIYINQLRESLDAGFLGIFGGPDPDELSEEIAGLGRATGDLSKEEAGVFAQFVAQGEEMDKDVVDQFIEDGYWDEDVFAGEVENFSQELGESFLPHGQEFIPRYLHLGGEKPELGLVHAINDKKGIYEYVSEDGQKIKVDEDKLQQILSQESAKQGVSPQGGEAGVEVKIKPKPEQEPSQPTEVGDETKPEESPSENVKQSEEVSEKTQQPAEPKEAEKVEEQPEPQSDKPEAKANQPIEEKSETKLEEPSVKESIETAEISEKEQDIIDNMEEILKSNIKEPTEILESMKEFAESRGLTEEEAKLFSNIRMFKFLMKEGRTFGTRFHNLLNESGILDEGNIDSENIIEKINNFKEELNKTDMPFGNEPARGYFAPRYINDQPVILKKEMNDLYTIISSGGEVQGSVVTGPDSIKDLDYFIKIGDESQEFDTEEELENYLKLNIKDDAESEASSTATTTTATDTQPTPDSQAAQPDGVVGSTTEINKDDLPENLQDQIEKYQNLVDKNSDYQNVDVSAEDVDGYDYYKVEITKNGEDIAGYFNEAGERIEDGLMVQFIKQGINPESEAAKEMLESIGDHSAEAGIFKKTIGDKEYFVYNKNGSYIGTEAENHQPSEYFETDGTKMNPDDRGLIESGVDPTNKEAVNDFKAEVGLAGNKQILESAKENASNYIKMANKNMGMGKNKVVSNLTNMFAKDFNDQQKAKEFAEWAWRRYQQGEDNVEDFDFE